MKKKILFIFGTRPEAIKMAPVVKILRQDEEMEPVVCVTAQHREMLDQVLSLFQIVPEYDLNIMQPGQTLSQITAKAITGLEGVIKEVQPEWVLVHGDTTTTFVGALAAFYQQVKVGHVEAGLRSGNIYSPYPEEMNRILTSRIAHIHFAPTEGNCRNLLKEGIARDRIFITGNTVIDALLQVVRPDYRFEEGILNRIDYTNKKVILLTAHRRENWGRPMENIFEAVREIICNHPDTELIFPVHLNPKVQELAHRILGDHERIHLIQPLDYEPFANLMAKAYLILTDSGGIQEEAPALGKPVLVLRTETERPEAVQAGTVKMAGIEKGRIIALTEELLQDPVKYREMANAVNPYGDGKAAQRILRIMKQMK